jgi:hypothetical protein
VELQTAGIVSYGGVSGGVRSALVEKITLTTLKMKPRVEAVSVQNVATRIDANNDFVAAEHQLHGAESLLHELYKMGPGAENDEAMSNSHPGICMTISSSSH